AVEQLHRKTRLELLDLGRQGLLRDEQPLGRAREIQLLRNRDERAQQACVEIHHRRRRIYNESPSITDVPTPKISPRPRRFRTRTILLTGLTTILRTARLAAASSPAGGGPRERSGHAFLDAVGTYSSSASGCDKRACGGGRGGLLRRLARGPGARSRAGSPLGESRAFGIGRTEHGLTAGAAGPA